MALYEGHRPQPGIPSLGWGKRDGVSTGMWAKTGCQPLQEDHSIPTPYTAIMLRPEKTTKGEKIN